MFKIIQTLALVIMIVLFPPAALITISQNAVPGEMTYPLKLKLEDAVLFVASFTPVTKAWFALAQTNRRYAEASALLDQGINASESLEQLVAQADITAGDIQRVQNASQKEQILGDLSRQITTYNESLSQSQTKIDNKLIAQGYSQPSPQPTQAPSLKPDSSASTTQTPQPSGKSESTETRQTPAPTRTASPTPRPTPSPQDQELLEQQRALEETRRKLEELKKKLEEEQKRLQEQAKNSQQSPTPKPSPSRTPTPTPTPTPSPSPTPRPSPSKTPAPSPSPSRSAAFSAQDAAVQASPSPVSTNNPKDRANFNPKWNKTDGDPTNDGDNGDN